MNINLSPSTITKGGTCSVTISNMQATYPTAVWRPYYQLSCPNNFVSGGNGAWTITGINNGPNPIYAVVTFSAYDANDNYLGFCTATLIINPIYVDYIGLSAYAFTLNYVGETYNISAFPAPSDAYNTAVTWSTSNYNVASVSGGVVKAEGAGTCTIRATATDGSGVYAECDVTVTITSVYVYVTGIYTYTASAVVVTQNVPISLAGFAHVLPTNANDQGLIWATNSGSITPSGVLTVSALGGCTINVMTHEGYIIGYIAIQCVPAGTPVDNVTLNFSAMGVPRLMSLQLVATVNPYPQVGQGVTWSTSNPAVATVSSSGLVTSVGLGQCNIRATSIVDPSKWSECITYVFSNRPSNWAWDTPIAQGLALKNTVIVTANHIYVYPLTAVEWNAFLNTINSFRLYKGLATATFITVNAGEDFFYYHINNAVTAINQMGFALPSASAGQTITALVFTQLRDTINSIT